MRPVVLLIPIVLLAGAGSRAVVAGVDPCAQPRASAAYTAETMRAIRSREDVWGEKLIATSRHEDGRGAVDRLAPLLRAGAPGQKPLTHSGFHYVALSMPTGPDGATEVALHVADGGQVIADHVGGRTLTVSVDREPYGSCFSRLTPGHLAEGWLPILKTAYGDAAGNLYDQESFAGRRAPGRPLESFVRVRVLKARTPSDVQVSVAGGATRTLHVPEGGTGELLVAWAYGHALEQVDASTYDAARSRVRTYWLDRLGQLASVDVPDRQVTDAARALLVQNLGLSWRYSIGNPYEELSFPEALDAAQVMAEWGSPALSRWIIVQALRRTRAPYLNWKRGEDLTAAGVHYRLYGDRAFLMQVTPTLRAYVGGLYAQLARSANGLLAAERFSSDIPNTVYGLHSQCVAWEGLELIASAWRDAGLRADAARAQHAADLLAPAIRNAVARSERTLADGTLFVPIALDGNERPYATVTQERLGSYWNLVMPYVLASGLFAPTGPAANGVFRYMLQHGSRLLGLVRAGAYALYGHQGYPQNGTDEVYGINLARFMADRGDADRLVLSLFGQLAVAMTPGTWVGGEAAEIAPNHGAYVRATYLPPNAASNGAFLTKLRLMLVHEARDAHDRPTRLQLAFSTPRSWLSRPGRRIVARAFPTSGGPVSFTLRVAKRSVDAVVHLPARPPAHVQLRLRGTRIHALRVDGAESRAFDAATGTIDLSGRRGTVRIVATT